MRQEGKLSCTWGWARLGAEARRASEVRRSGERAGLSRDQGRRRPFAFPDAADAPDAAVDAEDDRFQLYTAVRPYCIAMDGGLR